MAREHVEIWLCVECMFADQVGELPEDEERAEKVEAGLERLAKEGEIHPDFGSQGEEDGYGKVSWTPCDCCGDALGGSRYRYALFVRRAEHDAH